MTPSPDPSLSAAPRDRPPLPLYVKASVAWHGAAAVATIANPLLWPWALGAVVLNHVVITLGGLWPRSRWLGPNLVRLPAEARARGEVALTIDDGPDPEVTPRVLDALDALGLRATFFCIAARAREHPALLREIVLRGHSVQNHSLDHAVWFSTFGYAALDREITASQAAFADLLGEAPAFFRAPAGLRNPLLPIVLARRGLALVSWTRRGFDTVRGDAPRVLASLADGLAAGDILLLHDGPAARDAAGEPVLLGVLPARARAIAAKGLVAVTLPAAMATSTAAPAGPVPPHAALGTGATLHP